MAKRIGFINYKFGDLDGVSLTDLNIIQAFRKLGHEVFLCAGQFSGGLSGTRIDLLHYNHPQIKQIKLGVLNGSTNRQLLLTAINLMTKIIKSELLGFIKKEQINYLCTTNVLSLGLNLPLSIALIEIVNEQRLKLISRECDFWWQREYYLDNCLNELLEEYLPSKSPYIKHFVINSHSLKELKSRFGVEAVFLPDLFDFNIENNKIDDFNRTFKTDLEISPNQLVILMPSRIVRRKRIDRGILLASKLTDLNPVVLVTGFAGDEQDNYLEEVIQTIKHLRVKTKFIYNQIACNRQQINSHKVYSLFDCYLNSDLVIYLSDMEGFGNQVVETAFFKKPLVINSYKAYTEDIKPKGFDFIEADGGNITPQLVQEIKIILSDSQKRQEMVGKNFQLAKTFYSLEANLPLFQKLLAD